MLSFGLYAQTIFILCVWFCNLLLHHFSFWICRRTSCMGNKSKLRSYNENKQKQSAFRLWRELRSGASRITKCVWLDCEKKKKKIQRQTFISYSILLLVLKKETKVAEVWWLICWFTKTKRQSSGHRSVRLPLSRFLAKPFRQLIKLKSFLKNCSLKLTFTLTWIKKCGDNLCEVKLTIFYIFIYNFKKKMKSF